MCLDITEGIFLNFKSNMDKKDTYTIIGVMFAVFFLGAALFGDKFPVGETILHDSTATILTINKNVYIGGNARVSGIDFKELGGNISEDLNGVLVSSGAFAFQTLHENPVLYVDSTNGMELMHGTANFPYLKIGANSPEYYYKKVSYVTGAVNTITVFLHGVSSYRKIVGFTAMMRDAATGVEVMPQSWGGTFLFMARIDSTYLKTYLAAGATDLANDTVTFVLQIEK